MCATNVSNCISKLNSVSDTILAILAFCENKLDFFVF